MSTIFDDFDFTSWASPDFMESAGLSDLDYEDVLSKFENNPSMEAAFALCWQVMDTKLIPDSGLKEDNLSRLSVLVDLTKPKYNPDGDLVDFDDIVHVHLSVGLALLLERDVGGQAEKIWELFDDALSTIKKRSAVRIDLTDDENEFSYHIQKSMELLEVLIDCKLFHRYFNERQFMKALECLREASELATYAESCGFGFDYEYPFPTIGTSASGANLIVFVVPEQKAVDAFESLYEDKSEGTDWSKLAICCYIFQRAYEDLAVESVYSSVLEVSLNSWDFWPTAYKLATLNLSPDEYYKHRDEDRQREAENRLRLYFFPEQWNILPEKARAALISADREYENVSGRRPIIFDHLRHAARAIMVESLWKPYLVFLRGKAADGLKDPSDLQQVRQVIEDDRTEPDLRPLVKSPYFDEFLGTISEDTKFVRILPAKLLELNEWANKVSHEHHWGYKGFEGQIKETYAEFLGIGRTGILPRLMRLYLSTQS